MKILYYTWNLDETSAYYKSLINLNFIFNSTDNEEVVLETLNKELVDILLIDTTTVLDYKNIFNKERKISPKTRLIAIADPNDAFITIEAFKFGLIDYILTTLNETQVEAKLFGIYNILREKRGEMEVSKLSAKDLELDPLSRKVTRDGVVINLRNKEYKLLELLLINKNRPVDRELISQTLWKRSMKDFDNNTGDVYITLLRKKIEEPFDGRRIITTVRGKGYMIKD